MEMLAILVGNAVYLYLIFFSVEFFRPGATMNNFRFTELSGFHSRCPRTPMPTQPQNRSLSTRKRPFEE